MADREAGSALDLDLTFVCLDDFLRGSRHAEQLLAERMGRMNDLRWIHCVDASRVVVVANLSQ